LASGFRDPSGGARGGQWVNSPEKKQKRRLIAENPALYLAPFLSPLTFTA
jgi:hypothetical protein